MKTPEAAFDAALALHQQGRLAEAERAYAAILKSHPNHFDSLHLTGVIAGQSGKPARSAHFIRRALAINPFIPQAHNNLGNALRDLKDLEKAADSFRFALSLRPDYPQAHNNLGVTLQDLGRPEEALPCFDRAIALAPDYAEAHNNRAAALRLLGRLDEAGASLDTALALNPAYPEAHNNRGAVLQDLARPQDAAESHRQAIALRPAYAEAHYNLGNALYATGDFEAALAAYREAVRLAPEDDNSLIACAGLCEMLRQFQSAILIYDRILDRRPYNLETAPYPPEPPPETMPVRLTQGPKWPGYMGEVPSLADRAANQRKFYASIFARRGNAQSGANRPNAAIDSYDAAIALWPDDPIVHFNRGAALKVAGRDREAGLAFERTLELEPKFAMAPGEVVMARTLHCDWHRYAEDIAWLEAEIDAGALVCTPFPLHSLLDDPARIRETAARFVQHTMGHLAEIPRAAPHIPGPRIRVGYFSPDLRHHPVAALMSGVFEAHDRDLFEIHAFSFGPANDSPERARIRAGVDVFHDISDLSNQDAARRAHQHGIDIAVDLCGYTMHCRPEIFAHRAAPVQASYIGFLGTMGAPWMDYLIADPVLIPEEYRACYAENIAYLPSYQANDPKRQPTSRPITRAEAGLPDDAIVFCSLNNAYKNTPITFARWAEILRRVPDSVLWLYPNTEETRANLAAHAAAAGIDPTRLIFFQSVPADEFIARLALADLFLDTTPYNAGATASDALRAGLPLLTVPGKTFSARLAASLLTAIDMPELIVDTPQAYVETAVDLALNPEKRAVLRRRLEANRDTTRLFDTPRFTRTLEQAFAAMHARATAGLPPDDLTMTD